jgi:molybdopterin synthase catalytic subunit
MRARDRWPIARLALLHRTGRVGLGEPSVIIAVATPHRAESFEACRWLIDTLKAEVPIWKKEVWGDGSGSWVHPEPVAS